MRKIRTLVGLPVIVNHRRIGRAIRAELSEDLTQLTGLWVASGFFGARFIAADQLGMLGEVSITADHAGRRKKMEASALLFRAVGTDGSRLGAITGAEIDEMSLRVEALELSCGIWEDLMYGRKRITAFVMNQETDCVIIDVSEKEKEVGPYARRNDERSGSRRTDRRIGSHDVRRDELAISAQHESSNEENRPLAGQ